MVTFQLQKGIFNETGIMMMMNTSSLLILLSTFYLSTKYDKDYRIPPCKAKTIQSQLSLQYDNKLNLANKVTLIPNNN